jgi:PIN domain nuclease of toxin-antitoxin system
VRLLLDTHIWLWSLLEPDRLSRKIVRALASRRNELWLSPISVWEFLVLVDRGRVVLDTDVDSWLEEAAERAPMQEAFITHEIARASRAVELPHQDPADRFLAATAKVLDLTLVTADERLMGADDFSVLANR